jgi:hypothetical protein
MEKGQAIKFVNSASADLIVDAMYESGTDGGDSARSSFTNDPLAKLLPVGNQGGFRYYSGRVLNNKVKMIALYSTMDDIDWPDLLDEETGLFYYYGDNKKPGHELHDTPRRGNLLLKQLFDQIHKKSPITRAEVPPIFIFSKAGRGRDVIFRGVAVPGAESVSSTEDLIAVWKTYGNSRFQNYRAIFTVLDISTVPRKWIKDVEKGEFLSENCPAPWKSWVKTGVAIPLKAPRVQEYRTKVQQLPTNKEGEVMLQLIRDYFSENPYEFEKFAGELLKLAESNIINLEITRPRKDGGRDAIGKYRLHMGGDKIMMDFAMEAKCYSASNSVGVKEMSRLISRLRHRQFGVMVTTSYVGDQAYKEIKEDQHPILIIAGKDIVEILISKGINTKSTLQNFLVSVSPQDNK